MAADSGFWGLGLPLEEASALEMFDLGIDIPDVSLDQAQDPEAQPLPSASAPDEPELKVSENDDEAVQELERFYHIPPLADAVERTDYDALRVWMEREQRVGRQGYFMATVDERKAFVNLRNCTERQEVKAAIQEYSVATQSLARANVHQRAARTRKFDQAKLNRTLQLEPCWAAAEAVLDTRRALLARALRVRQRRAAEALSDANELVAMHTLREAAAVDLAQFETDDARDWSNYLPAPKVLTIMTRTFCVLSFQSEGREWPHDHLPNWLGAGRPLFAHAAEWAALSDLLQVHFEPELVPMKLPFHTPQFLWQTLRMRMPIDVAATFDAFEAHKLAWAMSVMRRRKPKRAEAELGLQERAERYLETTLPLQNFSGESPENAELPLAMRGDLARPRGSPRAQARLLRALKWIARKTKSPSVARILGLLQNLEQGGFTQRAFATHKPRAVFFSLAPRTMFLFRAYRPPRAPGQRERPRGPVTLYGLFLLGDVPSAEYEAQLTQRGVSLVQRAMQMFVREVVSQVPGLREAVPRDGVVAVEPRATEILNIVAMADLKMPFYGDANLRMRLEDVDPLYARIRGRPGYWPRAVHNYRDFEPKTFYPHKVRMLEPLPRDLVQRRRGARREDLDELLPAQGVLDEPLLALPRRLRELYWDNDDDEENDDRPVYNGQADEPEDEEEKSGQYLRRAPFRLYYNVFGENHVLRPPEEPGGERLPMPILQDEEVRVYKNTVARALRAYHAHVANGDLEEAKRDRDEILNERARLQAWVPGWRAAPWQQVRISIFPNGKVFLYGCRAWADVKSVWIALLALIQRDQTRVVQALRYQGLYASRDWPPPATDGHVAELERSESQLPAHRRRDVPPRYTVGETQLEREARRRQGEEV